MDVDVDSLAGLIGILETCVNECLFVSLDLEFLGLHPEYLSACASPLHRITPPSTFLPRIASHVVAMPTIQLGIAFFTATPSNVWIVKSFNIYINPLLSTIAVHAAQATTNSLKFLRNSGFSLNKSFRKGLAFQQIKWLFDIIRERKILVVVHNGMLDLLHLSAELDPELKRHLHSYPGIKNSFRKLWPRVLDTKFVMSHCPLFRTLSEIKWDLSSLHSFLDSFSTADISYVKPVFAFPPAFEKYKNATKNHEAGYDAFVTGAIYLHMRELLKHSPADRFDHPLYNALGAKHGYNAHSREIRDYCGLLYIMKSVFVIDIRNDEERLRMKDLENIICIRNPPKSLQKHHIMELLQQEFGAVRDIFIVTVGDQISSQNSTEDVDGAVMADEEIDELAFGACSSGSLLVLLPMEVVADDSVVSRLNFRSTQNPGVGQLEFSSFGSFCADHTKLLSF